MGWAEEPEGSGGRDAGRDQQGLFRLPDEPATGRESERYHFDNEDVQDVFETARLIYKGEFDQVKEMFGDRTVKSDVGAMIGVMTDSDLIVERAYESKGGMNMCTALEKLEERGREEGRAEGRAEGKREMIFAFLKAGAEIRVIKEASGLSEEEIEKLRKEMK